MTSGHSMYPQQQVDKPLIDITWTYLRLAVDQNVGISRRTSPVECHPQSRIHVRLRESSFQAKLASFTDLPDGLQGRQVSLVTAVSFKLYMGDAVTADRSVFPGLGVITLHYVAWTYYLVTWGVIYFVLFQIQVEGN